jgi:hypothetical protein
VYIGFSRDKREALARRSCTVAGGIADFRRTLLVAFYMYESKG